MSDATSDGAIPPPGTTVEPQPAHVPFPIVRLLYGLGFAFIAWWVLWVAFIIGLVQFVIFAIEGKPNEELKTFSSSLVRYLWELLAFILFVRDDQPFPIGPFPKQ